MESNSSSRSSPSSYSVVSEASVIPPGQFVFKDINFEVSFIFDFVMLRFAAWFWNSAGVNLCKM